jgi:hypothetical protein
MGEPPPLTVEAFESVRILEGVKIRKFEDGFMVGEANSKEKISGKTKRPAHEMLTIDRSDPAKTVKYHRVQEYDEKSNAVSDLHKHTEISPSKHRPPKAKS